MTSTNAFGLPDDGISVDETPEVDAKDFALDEWLAGVSPTIRSVTLYQRADLIAHIDDLTSRLNVAQATEESGDRAMGEESAATIRRQLEQAAETFRASARVFKVQGRSDEHREKIAKGLKKRGIDDDHEIVLHQLVDAIIEPQGVTVDHMRRLGEVSEPQLKMLIVASSMANFQPPRVDVPFSPGSSGKRGGRTS